MYKLGIDIGGTKINIGITDGKNHLVDVTKIYISEISDIIESVKGALDDLCTKNSISKKDITSVGMGIPGTVRNNSDGTVTIYIQGEPSELDHFIEKLPSASGFAHIENIDQELASNVEKMHSFNVLY